MRLGQKNIFASFLLGLFGVQVFLPLVVCISVYFVRGSQWEFIHENFAHTEVFREVVLTENEYEKQDVANNHEIDLNGTLCDVHSVKKENGKYVLLVLCDEKETGLKKIQVSGEKQERSNAPLVMLPLFFEKPITFNFMQTATPVKISRALSEFLPVNVAMIQGPPPDFQS